MKKKKKIKNLTDLAIHMEMTRSFLKQADDDKNMLLGAKGLKRQMDESLKKFPEKEQIMVFYLDAIPNPDYNPADENDAPIDVIMKNLWVNKETQKVVSEPRWWKKHKEQHLEKSSNAS